MHLNKRDPKEIAVQQLMDFLYRLKLTTFNTTMQGYSMGFMSRWTYRKSWSGYEE